MDILPQLFLNSIVAASIYALVALGFNLIFSTVKFFDLGYGAMTTVGGYAAYFFLKQLGIATIPAVLLAILVAGIVGYLIYLAVYRPLRVRKATSLVYIVASLGVLTALQAIIAILFSSQFQALSGGGIGKTYTIGGGVITEVQLIILVVAIVIMLSLAYVFKYTQFGKSVKAIGDDEEVSKIVGINTGKVIGVVFFIGAAIAGTAGILVGFDTGIEPVMGLNLLLKGVVASIIGGVGNVFGGVLGAAVLGFAENFGIWKISGEWKDAIAYVLLIIFLIFRPEGLLKK